MENAIGFVTTWAILLTPPAVIRWAAKRPLSKPWTIATVVVLFFVNAAIFSILIDRQSPPHAALVLGGVVSWFVLRFGSWMNSEWRP